MIAGGKRTWTVSAFIWDDNLNRWIMPGRVGFLKVTDGDLYILDMPFLSYPFQEDDTIYIKSDCEANAKGPLRLFNGTRLSIQGDVNL